MGNDKGYTYSDSQRFFFAINSSSVSIGVKYHHTIIVLKLKFLKGHIKYFYKEYCYLQRSFNEGKLGATI